MTAKMGGKVRCRELKDTAEELHAISRLLSVNLMMPEPS
jgi:hypothetical protein